MGDKHVAYMHGDHYLWSDQTHLHLWVSDDDDGWDLSGWACRDGDEDEGRRPGYEEASGVSIAETVMDEFVVMRFAEMIREGNVGEAIDRALANHTGNFGAGVLAKNAEKLKAVLRQLTLDDPDPL